MAGKRFPRASATRQDIRDALAFTKKRYGDAKAKDYASLIRLALHVAAGDVGSHYQRDHRYPGTQALAPRRFLAFRCRVARREGEVARRGGAECGSSPLRAAMWLRVARCGSLSRARSTRLAW